MWKMLNCLILPCYLNENRGVLMTNVQFNKIYSFKYGSLFLGLTLLVVIFQYYYIVVFGYLMKGLLYCCFGYLLKVLENTKNKGLNCVYHFATKNCVAN